MASRGAAGPSSLLSPHWSILRLRVLLFYCVHNCNRGDLFPDDLWCQLASMICVEGSLLCKITGSYLCWVQLTFKKNASKEARNCLLLLALLAVHTCFAHSFNSFGTMELYTFLELWRESQRKEIWQGGEKHGFWDRKTLFLMLPLPCTSQIG